MDFLEWLSFELVTRKDKQVWTEIVLFAVINAAAFVGNFSVCYAVYGTGCSGFP